MGPTPRGGAYTYDWIENLLGLDRHSVDRILPEFTTRLISRNRFRLPTRLARIGMFPMEPSSLVMERRKLRGIKERAERLALARVLENRSSREFVVGPPGFEPGTNGL